MKWWKISLIFFFLCSCSILIRKIYKDDHSSVTTLGDRQVSLVFSHNINGETHPCGCRHFPLGGLPQVAGKIEGLKKEAEVIYIDTGDTLFPSSKIPKSIEKSLSFAARNIADGLEKMGLRYFVPGDQDFAMGWSFLQELAASKKFNFLLSNLKKSEPRNKIKHIPWAMIKNSTFKIFLLGFVDPTTLNGDGKELFDPVEKSLKEKLEVLKQNGFDSNNKGHRLIVLSHSGINNDERIAKKFPSIDWIIGAHSQSFFRYSRDIGDVRIGQVLSRNHYLGEIKLAKSTELDEYQVHEIRDEFKDLLSPNPFLAFISAHKEKMKKIQEEEQSYAFNASSEGADIEELKFTTALSCLECHTKQGEHWSKTPHALAYATLVNANEGSNLACIKCHSHGLGVEKQGFLNSKDIVVADSEKGNNRELEKKFMVAFKNLVAPIKSVRELSSKKIHKYTDKVLELERKYEISHNFSGVQCLNCHTQDLEHPYESSEKRSLSKINEMSLKNKCLSCHDPDQSPGWYQKNENGLPGKPDWDKIDLHYQRFACPKG